MTDALHRLARATLLAPFEGATPPGWLLEELKNGLGGVTLFALNGNVPDVEGLAALTAALREAGDPIITIDEEGGDVTRLDHTTGSRYPGNAALGVVDDLELTRRVFRSIGAELVRAGVNMDFAPSVDVNSATENPIIGTRAFGATADVVARHAAASVAGLQEAGVAACVKHFPGHGDTRDDSHLSVPVVDADLALLHERELAPFKAAIAAGTQALMTAHLIVPELTGETPATLSPAAITGLLRDELGYQGVVVTDALDMKGASGEIGIPEAAVQALIAGADLLCLGSQEFADSIREITAAIVAAVHEGRLPEARLEEAAQRVRRLKTWLATPRTVELDRATGLEAARRAVRAQGRIRLADPLVIRLEAPGNIAVGPVPWGLAPWTEEIQLDPATTTREDLLERAGDRPLVLVVRDAHRHEAQRALAESLTAARPDTVVVEMGLPVWRPETPHLATFGAAYVNAWAAAERLGLT
ncbi:glycoside hydrolase family 3 protein [Actinocorallia longicatena]|uniref:Glycoside hydrolase family 3 protein n=1 Tax=Actinocorallia longicatena TaxID=111803 RepID=A0ABP6QNE3_9ACTN